MNTSVRARHDQRGFSLVELLVAIVIAGIVFAAMVPLFMTVAKASSGDRARNIAMGIAQGRIDSIQLLSWSQLTDASINSELQNNTVPGVNLFGSSNVPAGYSITYQVIPVTSGGATSYVRVRVQVTTPLLPGSPPYTTTMSTIIISPSAPVAPGPTVPTITSFTPTTGPVGTSVTLTGTGFSGATVVSFNGTAATTFSVVSATQITASVPTGATTGPIRVTTPGGTATSATSFTVTASPQKYVLTVKNSQSGNGASKHRWIWVQGAGALYYDPTGGTSLLAPAGIDLAGGGQQQFNLPNGTYTILVSKTSGVGAAVAQTPPDPVSISSAAKTVSIN